MTEIDKNKHDDTKTIDNSIANTIANNRFDKNLANLSKVDEEKLDYSNHEYPVKNIRKLSNLEKINEKVEYVDSNSSESNSKRLGVPISNRAMRSISCNERTEKKEKNKSSPYQEIYENVKTSNHEKEDKSYHSHHSISNENDLIIKIKPKPYCYTQSNIVNLDEVKMEFVDNNITEYSVENQNPTNKVKKALNYQVSTKKKDIIDRMNSKLCKFTI